MVFLPKIAQKWPFFHFRWSIFFHTHPHYLWRTFLQFWTDSSGLKCSNMHKNMKKDRFSYFSWFFVKNCPKMAIFFIFSGQFYFHTHPHYLWPTFLQFWTGSSGLKCSNMHKNMKKARFSDFSWFCQKLPKNGKFFNFRWSTFFFIIICIFLHLNINLSSFWTLFPKLQFNHFLMNAP